MDKVKFGCSSGVTAILLTGLAYLLWGPRVAFTILAVYVIGTWAISVFVLAITSGMVALMKSHPEWLKK